MCTRGGINARPGVQVGAEVGAQGPPPRGKPGAAPALWGKWIFAI